MRCRSRRLRALFCSFTLLLLSSWPRLTLGARVLRSLRYPVWEAQESLLVPHGGPPPLVVAGDLVADAVQLHADGDLGHADVVVPLLVEEDAVPLGMGRQDVLLPGVGDVYGEGA